MRVRPKPAAGAPLLPPPDDAGTRAGAAAAARLLRRRAVDGSRAMHEIGEPIKVTVSPTIRGRAIAPLVSV